MKRSDIVRSIQVRFSRMRSDEAAEMMSIIAKCAGDALANGDRIEIRGFGSFMARLHAPKTTINPRTGQKMHLLSRKTILFRPSPELTKKMNEA